MRANKKKRKHPIAVVFGQCLKKERQRLGLTREDIARIAKVRDSYPALIELGKRAPSLSSIMALSKAVGLKASELVTRVEKRLREGR